MWGWLSKLLVEPYDQDDQEPALREAQRARVEAERKLKETERMGGEVRAVANRARNLRSDNHFSARIAQAFGSQRDH